MLSWLKARVTLWLTQESHVSGAPFCDFDRLSRTVWPADVILVEGNTRLSQFIKDVTQSPWTHSALYIGRLCEIGDAALRQHVQKYYTGDTDEPLVIEGLIGQGIVVAPLKKYRGVNLRVCRPRGLSSDDAYRVIRFAAHHLGAQYDIRQLFDLARWMSSRSVLPRRLWSTLFEININLSERTICSTLIAAAFDTVRFPVIPVVCRNDNGVIRFYPRNARFCTPRDFDYSPYFDSVKFPIMMLDDVSAHRHLPWDNRGIICNHDNECLAPDAVKETALLYERKDDSIGRRVSKWRHYRIRRRARKHRVVLGVSKT